jgi:hypothetical protein
MLIDVYHKLSSALFAIGLSIFALPLMALEPTQDAEPANTNPPAKPSLKLSESITNGHLLLEIRPRYAFIDESNKPKKTDVWTVRTTLGWQTAPFYDLRITGQYIYTGVLGPQRLNTDPARFFTSPPGYPRPKSAWVDKFCASMMNALSATLIFGKHPKSLTV